MIMDATREKEERLRECACSGDEEAVYSLLNSGVDVNARHHMNGWTALHWAAKRGNLNIAKLLLKNGADKDICNEKGETASNLCGTNPSLNVLFGGEPNGDASSSEREELPIVPNYIAHPVFPYLSQTKERPNHIDSPVNLSRGPMDSRHHQPNPAPTANSMSNQAHQPDDEELVLKVRVANHAEKDFIEIELEKRKLTFENLIATMCKELEVNRELAMKVRKIPDTILRKDKDVKRLRDFQELEVVLSNRAVVNEASKNYTASVSQKHIDVVY